MTAVTAGRPTPAGPAPASPATRALPTGQGLGQGPGQGRRPALATPAALRVLLIGLVLLSLAWGAFGGWVASEHSSAASELVTVDEGLSLDAQQMYQAIADADATMTAALLASSQPTLTPLQRYQRDLSTASAALSRLRAGDAGPGADASLTARPVFGNLPNLIGQDFHEVTRTVWPHNYAEEVFGLLHRTLETGQPYVALETQGPRHRPGLREAEAWWPPSSAAPFDRHWPEHTRSALLPLPPRACPAPGS